MTFAYCPANPNPDGALRTVGGGLPPDTVLAEGAGIPEPVGRSASTRQRSWIMDRDHGSWNTEMLRDSPLALGMPPRDDGRPRPLAPPLVDAGSFERAAASAAAALRSFSSSSLRAASSATRALSRSASIRAACSASSSRMSCNINVCPGFCGHRCCLPKKEPDPRLTSSAPVQLGFESNLCV